MHGGHVDALALEQFSNGEDLQLGMRAPGGGVGAAGGGFGAHGLGGLLHGDQHADGGVLAVDDAVQFHDMSGGDVAGLDREDHLPGLPAVLLVEVESAVDALVRALLLLDGTRADQAERPPLELVGVRLGELGGVFDRGGLADDVEVRVRLEGFDQAALHDGDRDVGDVDADPLPAELLRGDHGGAAAAEGVEHHVAGVGGRLDDALEEGGWFLGGITETLGGLGTYWLNIIPNI